MKVVLDTDPGIDDAMALLYLNACPGIQLLGICTVAGNADIDTCTRNALILREQFDMQAPVYRGAAGGVNGKIASEYPDFVHGSNGLGDIDLPEFSGTEEPESAEKYLSNIVSTYPGEITVLAVGRLTNLAKAIEINPAFPELVDRIIIMGGALDAPGNVTPFAEANIYGDPEAAQTVFSSKASVTMVGLDVTNATRMSLALLKDLCPRNDKIRNFALAINAHYANFYLEADGTNDFPVHDSSAVAALVRPDLFTTRMGQLDCMLAGEQRGRTTLDEDGDGNDSVCIGVDSQALLSHYKETINVFY